jgi:hypothetical protein
MTSMAVPTQYQADVDAILDRRRANGADFWATPDGRWGVGSPFSTFDCVLLLTELGSKRTDPVLKGAADVLFAGWRDDGRIRPTPKGTIYPCHTANAACALCRLGKARDERLQRTFEHFFATQHTDGGWRCNTVELGASAQTDVSNPGVTLNVLDAFRFTPHVDDKRLDKAVMTLLQHWKVRGRPGPCGFGIGTLFGKLEYPMLRYNLFSYVYVLSFYASARKRAAFRQALKALEAELQDGRVVVENPNRGLATLASCRKGEPSRLATRRYREILSNVG